MIRRAFSWLTEPMGRIAVLIGALTVFSVAAYGLYRAQLTPEQPIEFPHNLHVGLGIQCLYCHPGPLRGPSAGLPTETKCWGCHQQISKQTPELDKLAEYVANNEPIAWVPVAQVPDFVHFNHRPHIAAGVNCETCHGNMSRVTVAENPQVFNMGFCITCHRQHAAGDQEKLTKLTDCGTCHY